MIQDFEFLKVIEHLDDPACSAKEIAAELPIGETGVYKRLQDLDERGLIESKRVGPARIYWISNDGIAFLDPDGGSDDD